MCVWERAGETKRERERQKECVWERERVSEWKRTRQIWSARKTERGCVRARESEWVKENERDMKRAPVREIQTNLGLLERLQVSKAAAHNFSGSWAPNSLIFHSFITRELQTQLLYDVFKGRWLMLLLFLRKK
jgi:hypothetical protein